MRAVFAAAVLLAFVTLAVLSLRDNRNVRTALQQGSGLTANPASRAVAQGQSNQLQITRGTAPCSISQAPNASRTIASVRDSGATLRILSITGAGSFASG